MSPEYTEGGYRLPLERELAVGLGRISFHASQLEG
jgi:hypothetical protein